VKDDPKYGINQFKFDGIERDGRGGRQPIRERLRSRDHLIRDDLRAIKPDIFINLTTGTRPSPFWLGYADRSGAAGRPPSPVLAPSASSG
jgi:hypothetical protein